MARPRKKVDLDVLEKLAAMQATMPEMAAFLDVSEDTLNRRFAGVIKRGREKGKISLRRAQYQKALDGNATMQIWLGKQILGQKDNNDPLGLGNLGDGGLKKFVLGYSLEDQPYVVAEKPKQGEAPEAEVVAAEVSKEEKKK